MTADMSSLLGLSFFLSLKDAVREKIADKLERCLYKSGDTIFKQGDLGDKLYVIQTGEVKIVTFDFSGNEIVLAHLKKNDLFGEQAVLSKEKTYRNATAQVIVDAELIALSHDVFQDILTTHEGLQAEFKTIGEKHLLDQLIKKMGRINKVSIDLDNPHFKKICYQSREVIANIGSKLTCAYFILSGCLEKRSFNKQGKFQSKLELLPGQLFGEKEIIQDDVMTDMVVAVQDTLLMCIPKETINHILQSTNEPLSTIGKLSCAYDIPLLGKVIQYTGEFLGNAAICNLIKLPNGNEFITYKVINSNVFVIFKKNQPAVQKIIYQNHNRYRELWLQENIIVGFVNDNDSPDNAEYARMIFSGTHLNDDHINEFSKHGSFISLFDQQPAQSDYIVCKCMAIPSVDILRCISLGATDVAALSKQLGAGTVCGSCIPTMEEMLGIGAWNVCQLENIVILNQDVRSFQFKKSADTLSSYYPGQYIVIRKKIYGQWVSRSYTLTSIPSDPYLEITVKHELNGYFSGWLFEHGAIGDYFHLSMPRGEFYINENKMSKIVCFMGGIGVTPAIGFWRKMCAIGRENQLYIDYSINNAQEAIRQDLFGDTEHAEKNNIHLRITQSKNRINQDDIKNILGKFSGSDIFICGPKGFQDFIKNTLHSLNITQDKVHIEAFVQAGHPADPT